MARWKDRVEFLLSVIELLFLSLVVVALQGKSVKTRCFQEEVNLSQDFRGKGSSLMGNVFWFLQNYTHFAIRQCKLQLTTCRRFDTIPACDGRTDRQMELP